MDDQVEKLTQEIIGVLDEHHVQHSHVVARAIVAKLSEVPKMVPAEADDYFDEDDAPGVPLDEPPVEP